MLHLLAVWCLPNWACQDRLCLPVDCFLLASCHWATINVGHWKLPIPSHFVFNLSFLAKYLENNCVNNEPGKTFWSDVMSSFILNYSLKSNILLFNSSLLLHTWFLHIRFRFTHNQQIKSDLLSESEAPILVFWVCLVSLRVGRYQEALGPLLNAKRLQHKLGWAYYYDNKAQAPPSACSHWFFTLVGLSSCFQEVDQLEEARDHCDHALRVLTPAETQTNTEDTPGPLEDKPHPLSNELDASRQSIDRPHPLLLPLLRSVVRLSWQTGRDKRQWEELLHQLEEQWAVLDNQPTIKEFLVKHNLEESEWEG